MATANFGDTFFNKYFVITQTDDDDYFEQRNNIIEALKTIDNSYRRVDFSDEIATVYRMFDFIGIPFEVSLNINLKPGYYKGAYLDAVLKVNGYEYDNTDYIDFTELLEDGLWDTKQTRRYSNSGRLQGFVTMQAKNLKKRIKAAVSSIIDDVEKAVTPVTQQYTVFAQFSNGETWYKPA